MMDTLKMIYIVTFSFGHLFTLFDVKDYDIEKATWKIENLPFFPKDNNFKFKLKEDTGITKQYRIIEHLILRDDVNEVINSGDSDFEGCLIGNLIIESIFNDNNINKPIKRLWLVEQTPETIREEVTKLKDNNNFANYNNQALAKHYIDWLLGINLTRFVSVKAGAMLPVGRVLVPIVKVIYDRELAIKNFQSEKYYQIESFEETNGEKIKLIYDDKFKDIEECKDIIYKLNKGQAIVYDIDKKEVKKRPKKLFSLSKLQSELSKKYKLSMKESLDIIQKLYEKGLVTYPRTNTEYLAENEKSKIESLINNFNERFDIELEFKDSKSIFDDSKIESHSALTPTGKFDDNLSEKELNVYNIIKNRFISNFLKEETIIEKTIIKIKLGDFKFELKGEVVKQQGFLKYEPQKLEDTLLPSLNLNDIINHNFKAVEKQTSAPKKINTEMLLNALKNPFKDFEIEEDSEDYKSILNGLELGTEATRAGIIEHAKKLEYISEKNSIFSIEEKGINLIDTLNVLKINLYKEKTLEYSKQLKLIFTMNMNKDVLVDRVKEYITTTITNSKDISINKNNFKVEKEIIGKCPRCGKNIYESEKNFYCEGFRDNPKCEFNVWKNHIFFESKGKKLTKNMMKNFLNGKQITVKGFRKKDGTGTYDCKVLMEDTGQYINFKLNFNK